MPLVRVLVIEIIVKFNNFYAILKQFSFFSPCSLEILFLPILIYLYRGT